MSDASGPMVVHDVRRRMGSVGVWLAPPTLRVAPVVAERDAAAEIEASGYGSLWSGEGIGGKEAFAHHAVLLAATDSLVIGTGVANLWARHGATMHAGAATLAEAYPARFILGVGVSHPHVAERSGHRYERPLQRMREYLDQMDTAAVAPDAPPATEGYLRMLAALGPRMLELARERADGAHPFLTPVEHTARAREILGPGKLLIPHQAVVLERDGAQARAIARSAFGFPRNRSSVYTRNYIGLGYDESDLVDGLSDRLLDAIVARGDESAIARRVQQHLDAGADHVLVHPLTREDLFADPRPDDLVAAVDHLRRLASALT
ncbi:putative F420-dependent oxidoreductase [Nocardia nova SH22a]|uniref:Putative F420-dependent oxidoreductase n=1 Tax=Nocardia nova SH22a TaxID=1415166 RepID=W5TFY3_9NOCA|nr:TIGR03620 family F420-dependent LLM class oxidoreductase [Nocardia nova]AHH17873.1 putative F420-dependent oxidoreductase [Nocardia nova SH22a]